MKKPKIYLIARQIQGGENAQETQRITQALERGILDLAQKKGVTAFLHDPVPAIENCPFILIECPESFLNDIAFHLGKHGALYPSFIDMPTVRRGNPAPMRKNPPKP